MSLTNLEGAPGETIEVAISLEGTLAEERSGWWETFYKEVDGDDGKMDITAWIAIEPGDYTITEGETKAFAVRIRIPEDARPGLYGAATEEAGLTGHSAERRTYIIFRDTATGGTVYSGLLIPVSVKVLGKENPLVAFGKTISTLVKENLLVTALIIVIAVILVVLLPRRGRRDAPSS
jgi:hypothetical protein